MIERPTLYNTDGYNVSEILIPNAATPVAGGAGQTVIVAFVFSEGNLPSDGNYCIDATPSQACAVGYSSKTSTGFTLTFTPLSSSTTLSAGTVDVKVIWQLGA